MSEQIKHAAVKSKCGMIFLGKSHSDCIKKMTNLNIKPSPKADDQGFVTSNGRYVNRVEAATIAVNSGQVEHGKTVLFSEDLWSESSGGNFDYDYIKGYY